jgi:hypothetical protein
MLALAACVTASFAHAGEPAAAASVAVPEAIPVIATSSCWDMQPDDVLGALSQCAHKKIPIITVPVRVGPGGGLYASPVYATTACTPQDHCTPLRDVLNVHPAPKLLLQAAPAWLDDLQIIIREASAQSRVLVQPMLQRPYGDQSPQTIAPGLRYWAKQISTPRPMMMHVLEIDLRTPGLQFVVNGGTPQDGNEFVAEKTTTFVNREKLDAAINATYFRPFDGGHLLDKPYVPVIGQGVVVDGVAISRGHLDSGYASPDPRSNGAICIHGAAVTMTTAACPRHTTDAVGAGPVLLLDGKLLPLESKRHDYYYDTEPRTAVGLDKAHQRMWWVVIDGRQPHYSEGATLPELTALLRQLGADSAINMDGGGSSTLVLRKDGATTIANSPIHTGIPGRERAVGNHLGVRVQASP